VCVWGCSAVLIDGAHQRRQHGQPFVGAGIHPGFAVPLELSPVDLFFLDGAGNRPPVPAPRVIDGPLGQVQVERSDRDQALPIVQPWDVDGGLLTSLARNCLLCGAQPLFPGGGDLVEAGARRPPRVTEPRPPP
jgi:hypothetical protein